jgi:hypothetical protein
MLNIQEEYMKPDLHQEYLLISQGIKKANAFSKLIKNNDNLKNELYKKSEDLTKAYTSPSDIQRLRYIFQDKEVILCLCGSPKSWRNFKKGYNQTCGGKECIATANNKSIKKFYQEKYGVDHLFQTDNFKTKLKETFLSKYGVDNPWKNNEIKDKIKETNLKKFGESSWIKVEENRKNISNSIIQNNTNKRLQKIESFNIPIEVKEFSIHNVMLFCKVCEKNTTVSTSYFNKKISAEQNPCLECSPPLYSESKLENELYDYLKEIYQGNILIHDRKLCNGKEIDFLLDDLKIGFEFHGIWWHSEVFKGRNGNLEKKELIEKNGIKIYHIWEDDWCYKNKITKSRILNSIGGSIRIHGRKCKIDVISSKIEKEFLDMNHIQGYVSSKIKLGLFYNNELLSIMTFGSKRKSLGQKSKEGEYELLRFCNKLGFSVIGGASKLFNRFIKMYNPDKIISYQDNSWHTGNLYENLGFNFISKSKPNYYWCKKNIRFHRFNFRKDKLVKEGFDKNKTEDIIMTERGYYKLWGFGNLKWEYTKKA